jgi:uncharacterized protein YggE
MVGIRMWAVAGLLFFGNWCVFADSPPPALVTTTGQSEVKVIPDLADLHFEIEVRDSKLKNGLAEHSSRVGKLIAALKQAGVEERDLQTSQVIINPVYAREDHMRMETTQIAFFNITQTVAFTLRDIKKITTLTATAIEAGANRVGGVSLRSSKLREHRDKARLMAVRAAKEKAIALAGELGSRVGKPHSISEHGGSNPDYGFNRSVAMQNSMTFAGGEGGASASFEPGTISISATVTVAFVLE